MSNRPYFLDMTRGSDSETGSNLYGVRAGSAHGYEVSGQPINYLSGAYKQISKFPSGSYVLLDYEMWTGSQDPTVDDFSDSPYDEPLITEYNGYYLTMLQAVQPIARARNFRCGVYMYPALYRKHVGKWGSNDAQTITDQRRLLDQCDDEGVLPYFQTPEFEIWIPAYSAAATAASTYNTEGNTDFLDVMENLATILAEYQIGFSFGCLVEGDAGATYNPIQQLAIYRKAAQLCRRWIRAADGTLSYTNEPSMSIWSQGQADSGQTAETCNTLVAEFAGDNGSPYLQAQTLPPSVIDDSLADAHAAKNIKTDAVIYLPMADQSDINFLFGIHPRGAHAVLYGADPSASGMSTTGPNEGRAIGFNGADQNAWALVDDDLDGLTAWSGSVWLNMAAPGSTAYVVSNWSATNSRVMFRLYANTDGTATLQVARNTQGSSSYTYDSTSEVFDGTWHCVQWTMTGSELSLYADGALEVDAATAVSALMTPAFSGLMSLGSGNDGTGFGDYSPVKMAGFGMWDRVLTSTEMALLRTNP